MQKYQNADSSWRLAMNYVRRYVKATLDKSCTQVQSSMRLRIFMAEDGEPIEMYEDFRMSTINRQKWKEAK